MDPVPNYPDILPMAILLFIQFYMDHCALAIKCTYIRPRPKTGGFALSTAVPRVAL
jgi:hypothetical protein